MCGPPGDFWRASDVFTGRVLAIERASSPTERKVVVLVLEKLRGNLPGRGEQVEVFTRPTSLCGYPFKTGREYFIYGSRTEDGRITTGLCSRTMLVEDAGEELSFARQARDGNLPAGRIVGEVRLDAKARRNDRFADVRILVKHGIDAIPVVSDRTGRYAVELTSTGRYELDVELPGTLYAVQSRHVIDVPNSHACVERHIDVRFNGRVAGRVVDANGRGVAGLVVVHHRSEKRSHFDERAAVLTRDDGSYEIGRLPPGPFAVHIELPMDGIAAETDVSSDPDLIVGRGNLGDGERRDMTTFPVPENVNVLRLEGTVVAADGWSMADARVFLKGESGERVLGVPAVSDALGRFVLAVVEGERYLVFAERPAGDSEFSEPIAITAEPGMAPLRLVVRRRF
jgi:hypothetical protein